MGKSQIKNLCPDFEKCDENKLFHPFCFKLGPDKDKRIEKYNNFKFLRSGTCWQILTGKIYLMEVKDE